MLDARNVLHSPQTSNERRKHRISKNECLVKANIRYEDEFIKGLTMIHCNEIKFLMQKSSTIYDH